MLKRDCTIYIAKTMALLCGKQLICTFVYAYAKSRFSNDAGNLFYLNYIEFSWNLKTFSS